MNRENASNNGYHWQPELTMAELREKKLGWQAKGFFLSVTNQSNKKSLPPLSFSFLVFVEKCGAEGNTFWIYEILPQSILNVEHKEILHYFSM